MTHNPNQHERIRADLKAFADGELSPLARFFVARHLRGCPSCREELIQMQTLSTELQESEPEVTPLSSDLRAHILDNAPTADEVPEEQIIARSRRVARKKTVLALGVTSVVMFMIFTTITGSKVKNTFNKAADSMNTTTDSDSSTGWSTGWATGGASHDSSAIVGGAGGASAAAPPSAPSAASSASPGAATNSTSSVTLYSSSGNVQNTQNGNETPDIYPDGSAKPRAAFGDSVSARRGAADELRLKNSLEDQKQASPIDGTANFSVNLASPTGADSRFSVVPPTRAVHREGSISVAVENAESAGDDATNIVKNAGGFVASTALETGTGQKRTAVLDCRIPVAQFETVAKKISALGKVRAKSLSGQDITAQVARSGARRQTLSNELSIAQARLTKLENSRKPNAYDIYRVRAEVRTLRIQASQARAALETLQKYGSLSSLYVSLQDGQPGVATPKAAGWFDSLSPSSQAAWNSFLSNARLPLQLVLWVLAYSPLWLPALIIWRKYGRKWLTE